MEAGKLDRRITIEAPQTTRDEYGQALVQFVPLATCWAEKRDLTGRELLAAKQVVASAQTKFRIRYRTDFDTTARIVYGDRVYDIEHIAEIGRREGLEILAKVAE